jgi:hypothetical protein
MPLEPLEANHQWLYLMLEAFKFFTTPFDESPYLRHTGKIITG